MNWYYLEAGNQVGPIGESKLEALVRDGTVQFDTPVWHEGMSEWQPFEEVKPSTTPASSRLPSFVTAKGGVVCSQCNKIFSPANVIRYGDAWVCTSCKPIFVQKLEEGVTRYAGLGTRLGAKLIDGIILGTMTLVIVFVVGLATRSMQSSESVSKPLGGLVVFGLVLCLIAAVYTTSFVGKYGATPGKMACRIEVVTAKGGKVSYARALGRYFAECLSGLLLGVGYLMAAFDEQKRTLHDHICNTRVVGK